MSEIKSVPKTVSIDFDGTLCDIDYPNIGPIKRGAKEALTLLRQLGYVIIISSCRSCAWNWSEYYGDEEFVHACERPVYTEMKAWLDKNEIPYDIIDDGTKGKVAADYYVDDKAIAFTDNWAQIAATFYLKGKVNE